MQMGWQQKGSMRLYNSLLGISWLVGVLSKMVCDVLPMCKACGTCEAAWAICTPVAKHDCHVNHSGSSKSMEAESFGRMLLRAPERGYMIGTVVADDDSGIRKKARLQEDEGVLPTGFKIPNFLADPSHRIKVFGKYIYKLKNLPLKVSPVRNEHVVRLKQNWSYFIYTNRNKAIEEF